VTLFLLPAGLADGFGREELPYQATCAARIHPTAWVPRSPARRRETRRALSRKSILARHPARASPIPLPAHSTVTGTALGGARIWHLCYDTYEIIVTTSIISNNPDLPVQSVGRAVALVAQLATAGPEGLALKELHRAAGLKPTTVHSLLRSLQGTGFVEQDQGTGRYRLGIAVLQLAGQYVRGNNVVPLVEPAVQALHSETGETVQLGVLVGDRHHSVRTIQSIHAVIAAPSRVGDAPRLHCTALGKILLAFAPPDLRTALIDAEERRGFQKFGPATITTREDLVAELERVRLLDAASNYEEGRPGVIGQAAPVRDFAGTVVAAIGVAYPAMRRTPEYDHRMLHAVRRAGEDASQRLGWVPTTGDGGG
jgi:IclR family transcriptional regulator, KDG regulon repressor